MDHKGLVPNMTEVILLKLGGSVITHKHDSPPRLAINNVRRIAKELQGVSSPMIVVLGGGAHGHQAAHSFGYGNPTTPSTKLIAGIPQIRRNMTELSSSIEHIFSQNGINSVVIPPFASTFLNDGEIISFSLSIMERTIESGINVITHGDVCYDLQRGAAILSGDTVITYLAHSMHPKRILIGTDVDGIFDGNPRNNPHAKVVPRIDSSNREQILSQVESSSAIDVTGGMLKKVQELLSIQGGNIESIIFNLTVPGRLERLINGKSVICTKVLSR